MRIAMLTTGYPHVGDPVSGAFVWEMARALVLRGHTIRVFCAENPRHLPRQESGIEVVPIRYVPLGLTHGAFHGEGAPHKFVQGDPSAWITAAIFPLAQWIQTRRAIDDCDAIVSHFGIPCAAIGSLLARGRPHHAVIHGSDGRLLARMPEIVKRATFHGCTSIQISHRSLRTALPSPVPPTVPVMISPMGWAIPSAEFSRDELRRELDLGKGRVVLTVARLIRSKGVDLVIRAMREINAMLVIAGDGPERDYLQNMAIKEGINARFLGAVDSVRRDKLLNLADIFVAASREPEGAPTAVVEAMGAGLCVIGTRVGAISELIDDAGTLVPPDDVDALGVTLRRLIDDDAMRRALGEKARMRASAWRWDVQAETIERVLRGD